MSKFVIVTMHHVRLLTGWQNAWT